MMAVVGSVSRSVRLAHLRTGRSGRVDPDQLLVVRRGPFHIADRLAASSPDRVSGSVVGVQEDGLGSVGYRLVELAPLLVDLGPDDVRRGAVGLESDSDGQVGKGTFRLAEPPEGLGTHQIGRGFLGGGGDHLGRLLDRSGELLAAQRSLGFGKSNLLLLARGRHDSASRSVRPGLA
jgi:hypothetical protein